jgi:putative transposase
MARKRYKPEEIIAKLRQVDVLVSQGQNMVDAICQIGVSEVTYYRWRQEFGGLKTERSCMFPSVAPVRRAGSIARRNARSRAVVTTSSVSPPILSSLTGNTAAMAIARSPSSCARRAG